MSSKRTASASIHALSSLAWPIKVEDWRKAKLTKHFLYRSLNYLCFEIADGFGPSCRNYGPKYCWAL